MKKLIVILAIVLMLGPAKVWALPDVAMPLEVTGSQQIKAKSGVVYSVTMNYIGVTAGDKIQLKDAPTNTGNVLFTCVASSANGNCTSNFTVGAYFSTGIWYQETKSGGNIYTDIQYF